MELRHLDELSPLSRLRRGVALGAHRVAGLPSLIRAPAAPLAQGDWPLLQGQRRVSLVSDDEDVDPRLEAGKRVNVSLAAPCFDGLALGPDAPLSFWRQLGRIDRDRGFVAGRELRGGCVVPALGGGICLLANALFQLGAGLGWEVLQRHGHTLEARPCTDAIWGLDATVSWPQVDLRLRPTHPVRLRVFVEEDSLVLQVHARQAAPQVRLRAVVDHVEEHHGALFRSNVLLRDIDGRTELLAHNRKRLLHGLGFERTCLSCERPACAAREADLDRVVA